MDACATPLSLHDLPSAVWAAAITLVHTPTHQVPTAHAGADYMLTFGGGDVGRRTAPVGAMESSIYVARHLRTQPRAKPAGYKPANTADGAHAPPRDDIRYGSHRRPYKRTSQARTQRSQAPGDGGHTHVPGDHPAHAPAADGHPTLCATSPSPIPNPPRTPRHARTVRTERRARGGRLAAIQANGGPWERAEATRSARRVPAAPTGSASGQRHGAAAPSSRRVNTNTRDMARVRADTETSSATHLSALGRARNI